MTERRRTNEVYQQPLLRVSLLARDRLRALLPGAYAGPGWREVTAWPVN